MSRRRYQQNCALAHGLDLLGERWTLLIVRELLIQPCRFKDLERVLAGMGTNLLAQRLREMEAAGLVQKQNPERRAPYELTEKGRSLESVTLALIRWGAAHLSGEPDEVHWAHWDLLAMKALFNPKACRQKRVLQFDHPDLLAWVEISRRGFRHGMGSHPSPDVVVNQTPLEVRETAQKERRGKASALADIVASFSV